MRRRRPREDLRLQQDRAGRQERRANELQRILDSVRAKVRNLEDDFIAKMRQQQTEMTSLLQEKKVVHDRCQKHKEKLREQEENITRLRKRLSQAVSAEEQRAANQKKAFLRLMNREPRENNILDQQVLDVIDGYERRVNQLQTELRSSESVDVPVLERKSSDESLDLDTTPNYKALIKSFREQIEDSRKKKEDLVRENDQMRREMESRPSAKEFRLYKQQTRKMEKILLQNNIRVRGKEKRDESGAEEEYTDLLPAAECRLHLQNVCRELNVLDLKDLVPAAASNLRQAQTCTKLHQILSDISSVVSGPRAPQLLYKHNPRGGDTSDGGDFIHLVPTVELWAGQLLSLKALHRALRKLSDNLLADPMLNQPQDSSDGVHVEELLLLVDTMLEEVESRKEVTRNPSTHTLRALVSHFQKLFDVRSLSGVYPRMSEVYSRLGEVTNAMKNLRSILGLGDAAGVGTVVNTVWAMCRDAEEENGQKLREVLGPLDLDSLINKIREQEEFFPAFQGLVTRLLDVL
ncbi:PREDICTED: centrosomal protein of 70 kDa-like, partial [Nanorana parkeri]|uniref:centrosomal protein of 70 kDa-like n=1 Tax=Nanorana parkeri TaxID=125878 RepID=UPI0008541B41